jgi:hypothetical protein
MKSVLSIEKMSQISGGKFWDGFCVAVGAANFVAPFIAITGIGAVILGVADVGCIGYAASKL